MASPLINQTPFAGHAQLMADGEGEECLLVIAKASFELSRSTQVADLQLPICPGDRYRGTESGSSLLHASDLHPPKRAVDVLIEAEAVAPGGRPAAAVDVSVAVGSTRCRLRLNGPRPWQEGGAIGTGERFVRAPLIYELAAGGPQSYANPAGMGEVFHPGGAAPRLEWLSEETRAPAGLGPVAPHWQTRAAFAGTYDAIWRRERAPFPPDDFDPRFWQVAPPPLQIKDALAGRAVAIAGVNAHELVTAKVPAIALWTELRERGDSAPRRVSLNLDTVWISAVRRKLVLTFRTLLPLTHGPNGVTDLQLGAQAR